MRIQFLTGQSFAATLVGLSALAVAMAPGKLAGQASGNPWVQSFTVMREFYVSTNGTNGAVLRDYSGRGHAAAMERLPTLVAGLVQSPTGESRALRLNGVDESCTLRAGVCPWGSNCTIEVWIKTTSDALNPDVPHAILGQWVGLSRGGFGQAFGLSGGRLVFLASESENEGCADANLRVEGSHVNDGNWHHVGLTIDHRRNLVALYRDGRLDASAAITIAGCGVPPMQTIGGTGGWPFLHLDAVLDELRVYGRVLSEADIALHYNIGQGRYGAAEPGLVAGWHFDEPFDEQHPVSLQTALTTARAGDLFWLREGVYAGDFTNFLSGTPEAPIIFRARRGHRAQVLGTFNLHGSNVWIWGLELTDPTGRGARGSEVGLYAPGAHVINNLIHHGFDKNGIGAWNTGAGQVIYGNLVYENGQATNFTHGIYAQNNFQQHGYKYIAGNMFLDSASVNLNAFNVSAYAECLTCGPLLSGFWIEQNLIRNGRFLVGGFNEPVTDTVIKENYFYEASLQVGYRRPTQVQVLDNYIAHGNLETEYFWGAGEMIHTDRKPNVYRGNTIVLPLGSEPHVQMRTSANWADGRCDGCPGLASLDVFDLNHYSPPFRATLTALNTNFGTLGFASWTNATARAGNTFDLHSAVDAAPAGVKVVLLPNQYEPGRAHLIIYNWDLADAVTLDLSPAVNRGDYYRIHDAKNAFGGPRKSGTYTGPFPLRIEGEEFLALLVTSTPRGADTDADGIPDNWEMSFGFDPINFSDAHGDIDQDGMTELEEYLAGTDPHLEGSRLELRQPTHTPASFSFRVPTVAGRRYTVQYCEQLTTTNWITLTTLTGDGADRIITDDTEGPAPKRFYRVQVVSP